MSTPHSVTMTIEKGGGIRARFACDAAEGAPCRMECPDGCEVWPCEHGLVDSGQCLELEWLADDYLMELYDGKPHEPCSGPITIEWQGDYYTWRYADEETEA